MQKHEDPQSKFPRAQESLAPGSVDLTARIVSVEDDSTNLLYRVVVEKIHGYGMGTRPIAEGIEIVVSLDEKKISATPELKKRISQKDQSLRMTLQSGKRVMMQDKTHIWQIRKIK